MRKEEEDEEDRESDLEDCKHWLSRKVFVIRMKQAQLQRFAGKIMAKTTER